MPDDARERIFPQGIQLVSSRHQQDQTQLSGQPITEQANLPNEQKISDLSDEVHDDASVDISSDTDDIRRQAAQSRDPENGANII